MVTQACRNIKIVSEIKDCADASLVIEAVGLRLAQRRSSGYYYVLNAHHVLINSSIAVDP